MSQYALAIDIGASSGRHMLGCFSEGRLTLEEIYRFPNSMASRNGHLCWVLDALWGHVIKGMKECKRLGKPPASVGVDTWAVDYVLLDSAGKRIGDSIAYRDSRTEGVSSRIPFEWLYQRTGIARQPFNTVYQLMATPREQLTRAQRCLMIPDWFHYRLSGVLSNEYTNASTTALLNAATGQWDDGVFTMAGIPRHLFPEPPRMPGTRLGPLLSEVASEVGFNCEVILPATHDTGSAYMAIPAAGENAACLSSGTWSLLGVESPRPILSPEAREAGFTNEGGYDHTIRFLRNIMGLWMLQRLQSELPRRYSFAELSDLAAEGWRYTAVVDATDNRFLAPASMRAEVLAALREQGAQEPKDLSELLCCVLRSLAHCYATAIQTLQRLTGKQCGSVSIVGGGSQNRVLNQWTADATGLPVYAGPSEGTALGNVIAQLIALGELRDLSEARQRIREAFPVTAYQPMKGERT